MILGGANDSLIANSTFDGLDTFAFYVSASGSHARLIDGLRIENNIVFRGRPYSPASGLPANLVIVQAVRSRWQRTARVAPGLR